MQTALMWFRRDLRIEDNAALARALAQSDRVFCCFCFDREILDRLRDRRDRRMTFICRSLEELDRHLRDSDTRLIVRHGSAADEIPRLAAELRVDTVYANHDYEPKRMERDRVVRDRLREAGMDLHTTKDHVIFEKEEVLNSSGRPFRVFTPYKRVWRARLDAEGLAVFDTTPRESKFAQPPGHIESDPWTLPDLGFEEVHLGFGPGADAARACLDALLVRLDDYERRRNQPAREGTSRLSVHLRFGTISVREILREALDHGTSGAHAWIDQLIWRDFYSMVLYHRPETVHKPFQQLYANLPWREDRGLFKRWITGTTGYPIVDAGMRELNSTGWMHNRVRMIVASFLTKDLLINWKWGERYFAGQLLDYDLSQNIGNWQWCAGIGADAQPYFRIFNPTTQSRRYDPTGRYIREHLPELRDFPNGLIHAPWEADATEQEAANCLLGRDYPLPIVDHKSARNESLKVFKDIRTSEKGTLLSRG
jgi:deoxyribodipyrimidine photo-lyase